MTKHFVALDSDGNALATLTARDKSDADAFALRKLPGYVAVLESGSGEVEDVDATLQKLYEKGGMDSIKARIKVLNRSHAALHSYDLIAMEKAHAFAETEIDASDEDVNDILREAGLLGGTRQKGSPDVGAEDRTLEEVFKEMGLDDKAARIAAQGRR